MSQTKCRVRRYFMTAFGLVAALAAVAIARAQSSSDKWWPGYGNGPDNSRYFASRQINKSNVNQLQVAWTYPYSDAGGYPIVARGVICGRGRNGSLVAVDAKTGKELWIRENMNGMNTRGVMYWESRDGRDQRLIFPMNSLLQEIDAKTGKSVMAFGTNGVVDLRVGIDGRDPATIGNIQSNTPGEVFENLVIVGSATGEGYMSPPGDIRAYDVLTGKPAWTFHTVPRPGEYGYDTWPNIIAHDNPGILKLVRPGENAGRGGGPFVSPGLLVYQKNCQMCHGADRLGTEAGVPLVHTADSPANNVVAGTSRVDAATIRATVATGKSRMPAMPHITGADLENLVTYLTGPPAGRGRGPGGFGRGGTLVASGAPPVLIAGSGSAWNRPEAAGGGRGRGAVPPYPEGVTQYDRPTINEYNTVGNRVKPPFTSIIKYDLNKPGIQWRIPYGDDPALAARGITGTGTPGTTNSLVVTESGLVFGAGGDSQVRAWDGETGKQLWSSRFGGSFLGSLVMYEMDGRQYLLVPAASSAGGRGRGSAPATPPAGAPAPLAPLGWVAYVLPAK